MTDDFFGPPSPLDVEAYLRGELQGREGVAYGADREAIEKYLKNWRMPAADYHRRREVLESRRYSYMGSCPECEAEGAIFPTPDRSDVLVCSAGCKVGWVFGSGHFSTRPEDHGMTDEEAERRLSQYRRVEPLMGWKLELLEGLDVGIRVFPAADVADCVICGLAVVPPDARKLWAIWTGSAFMFRREVPALSLNRQAALCVVCGAEVNHGLQRGVNEMWGLDAPTGIGVMISTPHADLEE
jgi:hypothetical protein